MLHVEFQVPECIMSLAVETHESGFGATLTMLCAPRGMGRSCVKSNEMFTSSAPSGDFLDP